MSVPSVSPRLARKAAAVALCAAFVLLAVGPALPASAAPQSLASPLSGAATLGGPAPAAAAQSAGGSPPRSGSITDDIADVPAHVLAGESSYSHFASVVAALGDINNDGADEIGVVSRSPWAVTVQMGSASGFSASSQVVLRASQAGEIYGARLAGGGDLNGDGYGDFALTVGRPDGRGAVAYEVQVYDGQAAGAQGFPATTLDAPALPASFGAGLAVAGDVDGDGLPDLLVSAPPSGPAPAGGTAWIFRGRPTGLSTVPDWTYTRTGAGTPFGAGAASAGDLNGDGFGDFVVTTGGQPGPDGLSRIFVFYGAEGFEIQDPVEVTAPQQRDGFGASVAAGDFNADGLHDLLVGAPESDPSPEQEDAGRLFEYRGTPLGLSPSPAARAGSAGSRFGSVVANVGDISGDGIADAAVGAPLASADGPFTNGQVFLYFGGDSGLSSHYDMTEAGEAGYDLFASAIASETDFDGDGRPDLALGASGRDFAGLTDAGACYLYAGLRIRMPLLSPEAFSAPDLTDGVALARAPSAYHFGFTFVYRGPTNAFASAETTFLSSSLRSGVAARYDAATGRLALAKDAGSLLPPAALAEMQGDSDFAQGAQFVHSFHLYASLKFAWSLTDPNPLSVRLTAKDAGGATSTVLVKAAFLVVSSLSFAEPVRIARGDGAELPPGGWARAGDTLSWSGGPVVYSGTSLVPPAGEVSVEVANEANEATLAAFDPWTGRFSAQKMLKSADDAADIHTVRVRSPVGTVLAEAVARIGIDGTPVAFGLSSPANNEVVTEALYPVTVELMDPGSGVDGATVEWAVSHSNPPLFSDWQPAESPSGPQVTARALVPLLAQSFNFVRFRGADTVGNPAAYSAPIQVNLDYGEVAFALVAPSETAWQRSASISLTFEVSKAGEPLLDLATVEVEVDTPSGGGWQNAGLTGFETSVRFSVQVGMPDGGSSEVRVRVSLVGVVGSYVSPPYRVLVDRQAPEVALVGPEAGSWATEGYATSSVLVSDLTSGVSRATIRYRYLAQGASVWSAWAEPETRPVAGGYLARGSVPVRDGVENFVVWQAQDIAGNGPATSLYQRLLADSRPVAFDHPSPASGASVEAVFRLSIAITDGDGSGVDLSTIEFRVDLPDGASTGWTSADRSGIATRATVSVAFALPLGVSTIRWRAQDAAGTPPAESAPVTVRVAPFSAPMKALTLVLSSPISGGHYRAGADIQFDARASFDPDGSPLYFQWSIDGEPQAGHLPAFWMQLAPGRHTVTLVVSDGTESPDITIAFTVDPPVAAPGALSSAFAQALLVSFASLLVAALASRVWVRRARRALAA